MIMFWEWAFCVLLSMGAISAIVSASRKTTILDKVFFLIFATAEFMVAVMYIFKMMITAIGGI